MFSNCVQSDEYARKTVLKLYEKLSVKFTETLGYALNDLTAENCRKEECSLANLVADSFVNNFDKLLGRKLYTMSRCNNTLAVINGGNIRSGIDEGNITYKDVLSVLPFSNSVGILQLKGKQLIELFQHSARQYAKGGFLQTSRIRATYKLRKGQATLMKLQTSCGGLWQNVQYDEKYVLVITDFLVRGGDNFTISVDSWTDYQQADSDIFLFYVKKLQRLSGHVEGRILFELKNSTNSVTASNQLMIFFLLLTLIGLNCLFH